MFLCIYNTRHDTKHTIQRAYLTLKYFTLYDRLDLDDTIVWRTWFPVVVRFGTVDENFLWLQIYIPCRRKTYNLRLLVGVTLNQHLLFSALSPSINTLLPPPLFGDPRVNRGFQF